MSEFESIFFCKNENSPSKDEENSGVFSKYVDCVGGETTNCGFFVVQWNKVLVDPVWNKNAFTSQHPAVTFQVLLHSDDSNIDYRYANMDASTEKPTVSGIEWNLPSSGKRQAMFIQNSDIRSHAAFKFVATARG